MNVKNSIISRICRIYQCICKQISCSPFVRYSLSAYRRKFQVCPTSLREFIPIYVMLSPPNLFVPIRGFIYDSRLPLGRRMNNIPVHTQTQSFPNGTVVFSFIAFIAALPTSYQNVQYADWHFSNR